MRCRALDNEDQRRVSVSDDLFKDDDEAREFDEITYGGGREAQPLEITVRRYRKRSAVAFHWIITDRPGWENPRVVGRKYDNEVPTTTVDKSEPENPSRSIIGGSGDRSGKTGEIALKPGDTGFFGFWLKGERQVLVKGVYPRLKTERWHAPDPITIVVNMQEWFETEQKLEERRKVELLKQKIRDIVAEQPEPVKTDPIVDRIMKSMERFSHEKEVLNLFEILARKNDAENRKTDEEIPDPNIAADVKKGREEALGRLYADIIRSFTGEN